VQNLPEYKEEKLELEMSGGRNNNREITAGFIHFQLACKDINMMALARDALEPIVRGSPSIFYYQADERGVCFCKNKQTYTGTVTCSSTCLEH
jgi:hypothetical protein